MTASFDGAVRFSTSTGTTGRSETTQGGGAGCGDRFAEHPPQVARRTFGSTAALCK